MYNSCFIEKGYYLCMDKRHTMKFDNVVQYRFTSGFRKLIQKAAVSLGMKESVFVRVALRKELVSMGYDVDSGDVEEGDISVEKNSKPAAPVKNEVPKVEEKKHESKESVFDKLKKENPAIQSASEVIKWVKADLEEVPVLRVGEGKFKKNRAGLLYFNLNGEVVGFDYGGGEHYEVEWKGQTYRLSGKFNESEGTITVTKK